MTQIRSLLKLSIIVSAAGVYLGSTLRAQGVVSTTPSGGWLTSGNVIGPYDLPADMASALHAMGGRMMTANTAQIALSGTTTDATGSRAAQIVIQAPGYLSYREGLTRAVTFNGSSFQNSLVGGICG